MATWNETELATAVLEHLGVLASGQTAAAEDIAPVLTAWTSVYRQLRNLGLAPWTAAAIVEEAQLPLTKYLAAQVAGRFGFTGQRLLEVRQDAELGWIELQEQAAGSQHPLPPRFRDF